MLGATRIEEANYPEKLAMGPVTSGFWARVMLCRVLDQFPVLQLSGMDPVKPDAVKSSICREERPERSPRVLRLHVPWKKLGPSWDMILH